MNDLYSVLQVNRTAEPEVIRAAYRALARKNHPDFGGDAKRMAAINQAWAILGNAPRRAAYDAQPVLERPQTQPAAKAPEPAPAPVFENPPAAAPTPGQGLGGRRQPATDGTILDFGRYSGWSIGALVDQDPDYLRWLSRTPFGRRLTAEIDAALGRLDAKASAGSARPSMERRGGLFGGIGSFRAAAR